MKSRLACALFALALPLMAQEKAQSADAENVFYKAFYLERGERNADAALDLYTKFLAMAPDHRLARKAAEQSLAILRAGGKEKEATAFATKYEKLLGSGTVAVGGDAGGRPPRGQGGDAAGQGGRAQGGRGQGGGGQAGQGGRRGGFGQVKFADMSAEEIADFKTNRLERMSGFIDRMRENGNEDRAKAMEEGIAAVKKALDDKKLDEAQKAWDKMMPQGGFGGRGQGGGGQGGGGQGGGQGGGFRRGPLFGDKKVADMSAEELTQLKDGLGRLDRMIERIRQNDEESAKKIEDSAKSLKKALDDNKLDDAQKALEKLRESMPRRGGGGR
jgi:tetratricopeptide (TPR) repeat protein